jgi:hypothetical protein
MDSCPSSRMATSTSTELSEEWQDCQVMGAAEAGYPKFVGVTAVVAQWLPVALRQAARLPDASLESQAGYQT